jgi:hypothetical protein
LAGLTAASASRIAEPARKAERVTITKHPFCGNDPDAAERTVSHRQSGSAIGHCLFASRQ